MKLKVTMITLVLLMLILTGCGKKVNTATDPTTSPAPTTAVATTAPTTAPTTAATATVAPTAAGGQTPDVVTTASIVNTEDAFLKAISKDGTWIIAILQDMKVDKDLLMEGEFKNGKKDDAGNELYQRKLALYSQDENRNITARYTLTAPKLTVTSPVASIQHGTFKGDLYVSVKDFQLIDATVDGNVYFTSDEAKSTFKMDATSKVTGKQELKK